MLQVKMLKKSISVKAEGDLTQASFQQDKNALTEVLKQEQNTVVFDLAKVERIDAHGMALVVALFKSLQNAGKELRLTKVAPALFSVFDATFLNRYIEIEQVKE